MGATTQRQFERVLANRLRYAPAPLLDAATVSELLRCGNRACQQRQAAREAWTRVAPAELAELADVEEFRDGTLVLSTAEPAVAAALRDAGATLRRRLAGLLPGLRQLRVVVRQGQRED